MSEVESAKYWLSWIERGNAIALLLVAIGVGYEFVADRLAAPLRKTIEATREVELEQLRKDTAEAKRKQTEAEHDLEELRAKLAWRHIVSGKFLAALKGNVKPTNVEIVYLREDPESWNLANEIFRVLRQAGWPVAFPTPITPNDSRLFASLPSVIGVGGNPFGGIALVANQEFKMPMWEDKTAVGVLAEAFLKSLEGQVSFARPLPEQGLLPPGFIRIVVGPRMDPSSYGRVRRSP